MDMKKQLRELGYKERFVKQMSAEEAHLIISNQIKAKMPKKPDLPDLGTIILDGEGAGETSKTQLSPQNSQSSEIKGKGGKENVNDEKSK